MLLESSRWHSTLCYLTWKVRVTPEKRLLFQLVPSTPGIDETECGLWPTMESWDSQRGPAKEYNRKSKSQKDRNLTTFAAKMLPTPNSFDAKATDDWQMGSEWDRNKKEHTLPKAIGGQLNPNWVEWLMGFPIGWTDLNASGTP